MLTNNGVIMSKIHNQILIGDVCVSACSNSDVSVIGEVNDAAEPQGVGDNRAGKDTQYIICCQFYEL